MSLREELARKCDDFWGGVEMNPVAGPLYRAAVEVGGGVVAAADARIKVAPDTIEGVLYTHKGEKFYVGKSGTAYLSNTSLGPPPLDLHVEDHRPGAKPRPEEGKQYDKLGG